MLSMVIRFRNDADLEPLKNFMCGESVWKEDVREIFILDEEQMREMGPDVGTADRFLAVRVRGGIKLVALQGVSYMEKAKRSILIRMEDGESHMFYGKFEDIMLSLPPNFFRCHKSYIVNLEKVEGLCRYFFTLIGGENLPVSQKKYQTAKEYFKNYAQNCFPGEKNGTSIEK